MALRALALPTLQPGYLPQVCSRFASAVPDAGDGLGVAANRLLFHVPRLRKPLRRGEGLGGALAGRLSYLRRCVTALVDQERIELPWPAATETRQYCERLIQEALRTELVTGDLSNISDLEELFSPRWEHIPELSAFLELSAFWLQRPDLITKMLKILVPRYRFYNRPFTQLYRLQRPPYPDRFAYIAQGFGVLELHGNPWPPIGAPHLPKPVAAGSTSGSPLSTQPFREKYFINVLINAARRASLQSKRDSHSHT
ncbi:unnamed protein product [Schistocephalus solidus]|uniref:Large ribosomal subunit protein bL17m n=1 Tax=Schistocephalus solidus TaxID=70667 RepID=A0A3P7CK56_SCHSO|nr:unnamed protein product [Schistocephalus solidus]